MPQRTWPQPPVAAAAAIITAAEVPEPAAAAPWQQGLSLWRGNPLHVGFNHPAWHRGLGQQRRRRTSVGPPTVQPQQSPGCWNTKGCNSVNVR